MKPTRPVTIVGGGLAGLTLGIALRQQNVPVTIWEAGRYPRHRVCGEFVQGRGNGVLAELGLISRLKADGAREAETATFYSGDQGGPERRLPEPALCLSRHRFDAVLAAEFMTLGGVLRENERWTGQGGDEGIVLASGRRQQASVGGWKWFGLKAHARNVRLKTDLEMHLAGDGYVGLCRVEEDRVNVCGLFRRRESAGDPMPDWRARLRGLPGSLLRERLGDAEWIEDSACAVAGLDLRPQKAVANAGECRLGDALTMIPPFTGNGMSMALESASLAVEPLVRWSTGDADWRQATAEIASECDSAFRQRLSWATQLHRALLSPVLQPLLVNYAVRSGPLWQLFFSKTR